MQKNLSEMICRNLRHLQNNSTKDGSCRFSAKIQGAEYTLKRVLISNLLKIRKVNLKIVQNNVGIKVILMKYSYSDILFKFLYGPFVIEVILGKKNTCSNK